jgi:hypothetical protein
MERFFKYNVDEEVLVDLPTQARRDFSFKWSLYPGKFIPVLNPVTINEDFKETGSLKMGE